MPMRSPGGGFTTGPAGTGFARTRRAAGFFAFGAARLAGAFFAAFFFAGAFFALALPFAFFLVAMGPSRIRLTGKVSRQWAPGATAEAKCSKDEGVSRGFEERACARSSRRTPGTMQRAGQWMKDDPRYTGDSSLVTRHRFSGQAVLMGVDPQGADERQFADPDQADSLFRQHQQRELDRDGDHAGRGHDQPDDSPVAVDPREKEKINARNQQARASQGKRGEEARQFHGPEV